MNIEDAFMETMDIKEIILLWKIKTMILIPKIHHTTGIVLVIIGVKFLLFYIHNAEMTKIDSSNKRKFLYIIYIYLK